MSSLLVLVLVASTAIVLCGSMELCDVCRCQKDNEYAGLLVDCTNCSLKEVPRNLPPDTIRLILKHNQIQEIENNVFNNTKLRHIDLSNNQIRKLLPFSFQRACRLLSLDLHGNKLSLNTESYPNESFDSLVNLRELDISENSVNYREKYPDLTLSKLVSLRSLKMDGIRTLELGVGFSRLSKLRFLNFSGNCETKHITNTSFQNVKNIHALTLSGCKLQDIHDSAFGVFENLQFLDISYNEDLGLNKSTTALRNLRSSQFRILNITAVERIFGISLKVEEVLFRNIQHLNITQIYMNSNRIELFSLESVASLPLTVKFVGLRDNLIAYGLYVFAFFIAPNLECLDVSYQYVSHMPLDNNPKINTWSYINSHCYGLQNYVEISENYISDSNTDNEISENFLKVSPTLSSVHKDMTYDSNTEDPVLGREIIQKLPSADRAINHVHVKPVMSLIYEKENRKENRANKRYMQIGNSLRSDKKPVTVRQDPYPRELNTPIRATDVIKRFGNLLTSKSFLRKLRLRSSRNIPIPLPMGLRYFNGSTSKFGHDIPPLKFMENNVKVLDISSNVIRKFIGPVYGLHQLEWLSLGNNLCNELHKGFFTDFGSLKHLFLYSNYLDDAFEKDLNGDILKPLNNLETIDISNNKLRILPSSLLSGLRNLKRLDISTNTLTEWTLILDHMHQLEFINMSKNLLETLPASFRNFADRQFADNQKLTIDMSGQLLKCHCENLEFYKWMDRNTTLFVNRTHYKCRTSDGEMLSLENLDTVIMYLEKKCVSWTLLIIIMTCSVVLIAFIVVVALLYRYRWKIRYVYYLARSKYRGYYGKRPEIDTEFTYDAFISYADNDRYFVVNQMIQNLETIKGKQLCIHHRDFLVGEIIAANILNAVRNSRKTVIILTKNLLKSYWCMYELNMALMESLATGRNVLVVVVYESIPSNELPNDIVKLMSTNSYLEYPNDPDGKSLFWENLSVSISVD